MSFLDKVKILRKDSNNASESISPTYGGKTITESQVQELVVKIPGLERRLNDVEETLNTLIEGLIEKVE